MKTPCSCVPNIVKDVLFGSFVENGLWIMPIFGIPLIVRPKSTVTALILSVTNSAVASKGSIKSIAS